MSAKRILVVDDEAGVRELYREELSESGYAVETAASAREALQAVKASAPDLVTVDIKMPEEDGISLLREIKERWPRLPVVICTAYPVYRQEFGAWASDAYVVKSADLGELKKTLRTILGE